MENIDLNALRKKALENGGEFPKSEPASSKVFSTDELKAFSPERQAEFISDVNKGVPIEEQYDSFSEYLLERERTEKHASVPDVNKLRKQLGL